MLKIEKINQRRCKFTKCAFSFGHDFMLQENKCYCSQKNIVNLQNVFSESMHKSKKMR